jgi:hypothetical protein
LRRHHRCISALITRSRTLLLLGLTGFCALPSPETAILCGAVLVNRFVTSRRGRAHLGGVARAMALAAVLWFAACGGGPKKSRPPQRPIAPAAEIPEPAEPDPEPVEPPAPPPTTWHAAATLSPVEGARIKSARLDFRQQDGESTSIESVGWFEGLRRGTYHLVVHESDACGKNARRVGRAIVTAATFEVDATT